MLRKLQRALGSPLTLQGGMGLLLVSCSVVFDSLRHPRPVAHQAPLSIGFSRQEYQSGLPLPPPGDLPDPGIEPCMLPCSWLLYHWTTREAGCHGYDIPKHSCMLTACFPLHLWTKNVTGLFSKQRLSPWHQLLASAAAPKGAPWGQFRMEQSKLLALNSSDAHLEMISMGQTLYCPIHRKALKSLTWDIWCF